MKIYVGADHNGYQLRERLLEYLKKSGYKVVDEGDEQRDPNDDFPVFASRVVNAMKVSDDTEPRGILICGSGQGMCIAANRYKGIRASLVWDQHEARLSRNDDDSNVLCLPARILQEKEAELIIDTWLKTPFAAAPRYIRRNHELDELH